MENQYPVQLTSDEFSKLVFGLEEFLASDYGGSCLDDTDDRLRVATGVASWMISEKVELVSPERILPKAKYRLGFDVTDEATGEHVIRLILDRTREMEDGDFLQLQNFFWSTIGRAIRDNPDVVRTLRLGGVHVEIDPAGGQQAAV